MPKGSQPGHSCIKGDVMGKEKRIQKEDKKKPKLTKAEKKALKNEKKAK